MREVVQSWDGGVIRLGRAKSSDVVGDRRWESGQGLSCDELVDFVSLGQVEVHTVHVDDPRDRLRAQELPESLGFVHADVVPRGGVAGADGGRSPGHECVVVLLGGTADPLAFVGGDGRGELHFFTGGGEVTIRAVELFELQIHVCTPQEGGGLGQRWGTPQGTKVGSTGGDGSNVVRTGASGRVT